MSCSPFVGEIQRYEKMTAIIIIIGEKGKQASVPHLFLANTSNKKNEEEKNKTKTENSFRDNQTSTNEPRQLVHKGK